MESKEKEAPSKSWEEKTKELYNLIYKITRSEVVGELVSELDEASIKEGSRQMKEKIKDKVEKIEEGWIIEGSLRELTIADIPEIFKEILKIVKGEITNERE